MGYFFGMHSILYLAQTWHVDHRWSWSTLPFSMVSQISEPLLSSLKHILVCHVAEDFGSAAFEFSLSKRIDRRCHWEGTTASHLANNAGAFLAVFFQWIQRLTIQLGTKYETSVERENSLKKEPMSHSAQVPVTSCITCNPSPAMGYKERCDLKRMVVVSAVTIRPSPVNWSNFMFPAFSFQYFLWWYRDSSCVLHLYTLTRGRIEADQTEKELMSAGG